MRCGGRLSLGLVTLQRSGISKTTRAKTALRSGSLFNSPSEYLVAKCILPCLNP